ncbi:MAG TPA: N-acetylglucosamine-6-phosphate deacetylase [Firmicutes bacterium]|nr:N-acetylglucosamine-6-phosphate deacetylase [Bacillota bacterium]HBM70569.1 N-acetylglucosamine-6-phosphate deacetylase [Bacillota bacterium]
MLNKKITGFKNVNVCFEDGVKKSSIEVKDGHIFSFLDSEGALTLPSNLIVCPGLIDEHIHGCLGFDVMDAKKESLQGMANALLREGVTSFLATTMTEKEDKIISSLENVASFMETQTTGARVLGAHLEGPFISKKFKGAQSEECILKPDVTTFKRFEEASKNSIKLVTFAYEEDDGSFLKYLVSKNIVPSVGHSSCPSDKLIEGVENGVSCITHLYNAQRPFTHHDSGVTGVGLANDKLYTELIADFYHSTKESVKVALKCKYPDKLVLISDSTEAKYLPEGNYYLGSTPIYSDTHVAKLLNGTIAGSVLRLDQALKNVTSIFDMPFHKAIALSSNNPASNLHLKDRGFIRKGYHADFVIMDSSFEVYLTITDGEIAYIRPGFDINNLF